MIHAFLVTIGIIAAIALAPVVFAVLRNPFFWIVGILGTFTLIAVFVIVCLVTAPHDSQKSFAEQRYEGQIAQAQAASPATPVSTPTKAESLDPIRDSGEIAKGLKTQLEIDDQREREFNAQYLKEAQAATQRWNEAQGWTSNGLQTTK